MAVRWCLSWLQRLCEPSASSVKEEAEVEQVGVVVDFEKRISLREVAERIAQEFEFADEDVRRATEGFVRQMNEGLRSPGCTIEQLPSYITELPTGAEKGTYLAIDLGGTNMRVCSVTLEGDGRYTLVQEKVAIPGAHMTSKTARGLFGWVAETVKGFLQEHYSSSLATDVNSRTEGHTFNLGFTFSHAVNQMNINSGTLIRWSKGFDIDGVVGHDICALLQDAFNEAELPVRVTALINDTVGTLLARAYASPISAHTILGAVFGTGTNGAYVEQASKISKLNSPATEKKGIMIVNSEWGNFDQKLEYLPKTAHDVVIDRESVNPGFEMFEKRVSGMYLGEILRLAIISLLEDPGVEVFVGSTIPRSSKLYVQWGLDSSLMSYLEMDTTPELSFSKTQLEKWTGIANANTEDVRAIRTISHAIGRRSARLSAVALGAVIVQNECWRRKEVGRVDIGVDGSLIELYPGFVTELRHALRAIGEIGNAEERVDIVVAKDGSGVGAALAAHIAARRMHC